MGKYFTIEELCRSSKAKANGIENKPNEIQKANMERFISVILDPIRTKWGAQIIVNSGYRCELLNKLVGGVTNSHHLYKNNYCAADITTKCKIKNAKLFKMIKDMNLPVCQCIDEYGYQWIHVSYHPVDIRKQFLHKK
jgi:hypothetical protein